MSIALAYDATLSRVRVTGVMPGFLDTFTRTVANGWGTSDSGATWTLNGGVAGDYSVGSGVGVMSHSAVNVTRRMTDGASEVDSDRSVSAKTSALAVGGDIIAELVARYVDANNYYRARLAFTPASGVVLSIRKRVAGVDTVLTTVTTGLAHIAANRYALRFRLVGNVLSAKMWAAAGAEPTAWTASIVDSSISAAGPSGAQSVLSTTNTTTLPVTVNFDNLIGRGEGYVERSVDQIRWTVVRGGSALDGTVGAAVLVDDYEFTPNVLNYYRVRRFAVSSTDSITPAMDSVWIKNLARPFLNRAVTVVDWSDITYDSRNAVFPIVGRRLPIALSDVRLAKRYELTLLTNTVADADELATCFASGEPVLVHIPGETCPVPGGYAVVGDLQVSRNNARSPKRFLSLPLVEVAPPGPDVIGATMTWQTVISSYATWADVIAANATWQDLLDGIADPADVVVS